MTRQRPAIAYRPQGFEEVVGQERAVNFLAGLIRRGKKRRGILLHGAVGSGKTTLARIYAKALNCDKPDEATGSPCNDCIWCSSENEYLREYDVAREGGGKDKIVNALELLERRILPTDKVGVLFLDEAHRLTADGTDSLLKAIEEKGEKLVFILATSEHEALRPALASRLIPLEVQYLPLSLATELLRGIADQEGVDADEDGLELLAGLTPGSPRNLVNSIERFKFDGRAITVEVVKELLGVEAIDVLPTYLSAVASGDLLAQRQALADWREPARRKLVWVRLFLTSIYYRELLGLAVSLHPVVDAIPDSERVRVLGGFRQRLPSGGVRIDELWSAFMQHWNSAELSLSEAAFVLLAAEFDVLVRDTDRVSGPSHITARSVMGIAGQSGFDPRPSVPSWAPPQIHRKAFAIDDLHFLSAADVRDIYNSASFLIQEYGRTFDCRVSFVPDGPTAMDAEEALLEADVACQQLGSYSSTAPVPFVRVGQRQGSGLAAQYAVSLMQGADDVDFERARAAKFLGDWRDKWFAGSASRTGVRLEFETGWSDDRLKFHWASVRALCNALGVEDEDYDPRSNGWHPLRKLLRLGSRPTIAQPLRVRVVETSDVLSALRIEMASSLKLSPISAFDHRRWADLYTGWEIREYEDRHALRRRRQAEVARLTGSTRDPASATEVFRRLEASWPDDALARPRSAPGWWRSVRRERV